MLWLDSKSRTCKASIKVILFISPRFNCCLNRTVWAECIFICYNYCWFLDVIIAMKKIFIIRNVAWVSRIYNPCLPSCFFFIKKTLFSCIFVWTLSFVYPSTSHSLYYCYFHIVSSMIILLFVAKGWYVIFWSELLFFVRGCICGPFLKFFACIIL